MNDLPALYTFKEAMAYLKVSPGHKVGNSWRFTASALAACVREVA